LKTSRPMRFAPLHLALILTIIIASFASLFATPARAFTLNPATVFINEIHYDNIGADTGEAIEIAGPAGTDLTGWSIVRYNGSTPASGVVYTSPSAAETLSGTIPDSGNGFGFVEINYPVDGIQNGGNDAIALVNSTSQVVQFLGYEGVQVASNGPASGLTSTDIGVTEGAATPVSFSLQLSGTGTTYQDFAWQAAAAETFGAVNTNQSFGSTEAAPSVVAVVPTNGAPNIAADSSITVSFSEAVDVAAGAINVECPAGTSVATNVAASNVTSVAIDPAADLPAGESCTITVAAAGVTDVDADDPPDTMAADFSSSFSVAAANPCIQPFTPIFSIQGSGLSAAITGTITTQGVVVGDFEGTASASGFYIQDLSGDGDPATSDGLFVFTGSANLVSAGQVVRVTGYARERFNQTAINGSNSNAAAVTAANIVDCGIGSVATTDVTMPFADATAPERYEGMLVRLPQPLVIAEYFNYDRFGELVLALPLDGEDRPFNATAIDEPGAAANARTLANSLRRITLDDAQSAQNPPVLRHPNGNPFSLTNLFRGGDTVQNTVGVLGYDFNLYRIVPTGPADYTPANPRPAAPQPIGGTLRVAAMNTLNFFVTADYPTGDPLDNTCGPLQNVECRGWDSDQSLEFTRQRDKLLTALTGLDADIIGLNELENTPNAEPLASITSGMPGYDYINTGTIGTDAIKVGLIYRPAVVTPVGAYQTLDSADDPRFLDTKSRPALAQTFEVNATGARFTVVVNHLKSKGSDCIDVGDPDLGDGQGNCSQTRRAAAEALVDWLATDPTGSGDPDFIIMGDLNSYAQEDTIDEIKAGADDVAGTGDDFTNLIALFQGLYAYSYTFDGQAGYLDHALASSSLLPQITGAADWHINSDEPDVLDYDTSFKPAAQDALYEVNPYRTSDHDPVVVGLQLDGVPPVTTASVTGAVSAGCPSDCFAGSATVTLSPNEAATTQYRVNGGAWAAYSGPFVITAEGTNLVEFFSTDAAGNVEGEIKSITVKVTTFPSAAILDTFNRPNAGLGSRWDLVTPNSYRVLNNQAVSLLSTPALWRGSNASTSIYGADQEAAMTLTNPDGLYNSLLLKVQPGASGGVNSYSIVNGYLAVAYDSIHEAIYVQSFTRTEGLRHLATFEIALQPGDMLGARALADGSVRVYVNCEQIGVVQAPAFAGKGGRVGVFFVAAFGARFDDFRGGNVVP
jgi:uncharacterized protein